MRNDFSPRQLAEAIGVSESSVKRWIDDGTVSASRTSGGHRRVPLREAVRFIRDSGMPVVRPEVLGLVDLETVRRGKLPEGPESALKHALIAGRADLVRGIVVSQYLAGASPAGLCDGPIAGAMREVGELWRRESGGLVTEHRATDLCIQALSLARSLVPLPAKDAPVAVGGAPPGDPYLLASIMSAFVLEADGWNAINLGPDIPLDALAGAAEEQGASLAWLSIGGENADDRLALDVGRLADRLARSGVRLVLGGRALPPALEAPGPAHWVGHTLSELAAFARGLREGDGGRSRRGRGTSA
jgi:excisionase family DNA binding protein